MNECSENCDEFKIIFLGNSGSGKSSIIQKFICDDYNPDQLSTLGVAFSCKVLNINKKKIKLKLFDTGGQEKYRALSISYFRHADVVLFVFDLNLLNSFNSIQYWIDLFNENNDGKKVKLKYLIGNKCHLEQKVSQDLIDELAKKNGLEYMKTSTETKSQVDEMFEHIANDLCEYIIKNEKNNTKKNTKKGKILSKTDFKKYKAIC